MRKSRLWYALIGVVPLVYAPPADLVFALSPASRLEVKTGKAGLLGFAGHEHLIRARAFSGHIVYRPDAPDSSRVDVLVLTDSLEVLTPPDTEEIRKVTAAMRTEVLDVARYPEIRLQSRTVTVRAGTAHMLAALTMHGETHDVPVDVQFEMSADTLRATTTFVVKQTAFGIRPFRGGPGGTVRVADNVTFDIRIVAIRTNP
ncbi:MAG TPA: YceI family protein [Gemmatimonadales bacterium]|jgi:polyisoprenoid-binding protein YceI|nr:YceI family protein [Gemmatimonadales bacterium]